MISKKLQHFIETTGWAYVASADQRARPHLAAGRGLKVPDSIHIVFETWLCPRTMENIAEVPRVAVAVVDPASGIGFQFACRVEKTSETILADSIAAGRETPGLHQVQWRIEVLVEEIMEFSIGVHSDRPMSALV